MNKLKIIFAGTPEFAALHLQSLIQTEHEIVAVYTQPDKPAGRGQHLQLSAVKQLALKHNLPIYQPQSLRSNAVQAELKSLNADVMIVVAYGLILPKAVLDAPRLGCLNVHGSLLPRWRGAAPIQRAIWAGDKKTGITIMQMNEGLDTGDMLYKVETTILPTETSASLYAKLAQIGPQALIHTLSGLESGQHLPQKQNEDLANYATKLSKKEARLDWKLSASQLERNIRAFNPTPMAYLTVKVGEKEERIKIHQAHVLLGNHHPVGKIIQIDKMGLQIATGEGILNIISLQPSGKKAMSIQDFLNGRDWFHIGMILD